MPARCVVQCSLALLVSALALACTGARAGDEELRRRIPVIPVA